MINVKSSQHTSEDVLQEVSFNDGTANAGDASGDVSRSMVVSLLVRIVGDQTREDQLQAKVKAVGLCTMSDFELLDVDKEFCDVLNPVQLGKLRKAVQKGTRNVQESASDHILEFRGIFGERFYARLLKEDKLQKHERSKVINDLALELTTIHSSVTEKMCEAVAAQIQSQFKSLSPRFESQGKVNLGNQIYNCARHLLKLKKKSAAQSAPVSESGAALHNFNKRQNCGLDPERDLPNALPDGQTKQSLEQKRIKLTAMKETGTYKPKEALTLMKETYVLQRTLINRKVTMDEVLVQFPYFGRYNPLLYHFCYLVGFEGQEKKSTKRH